MRVGALAPADGFRLELTGVRSAEHDAAPIRLDGAEDQLHDPLEKLIQVENMADGLDGLIHDAQVGQSVFEPGSARLVRLGQDAAALGFTDRFDDGRRQLVVLASDHANLVGQVRGGPVAGPAGGVDEDALADEDVIAGVHHRLVDFLVVDKRAAGTAHVNEFVVAVFLTKLGVPPGNLGVVKADLIGAVSPDREHRLGQIDLLAFISAFDHDQARHEMPRFV